MYPRPGHLLQATAPINVRSVSRFYNIRGQRYIATTGYVTNTQNVAGELVALLQNPAGSGQVFLLDKAEFGATVDTTFSRYGGGTVALVGTPTARPIGRTDGGTSTSPMKLYLGGTSGAQFTVSAEGTLRKVATMKAYDGYQLTDVDGTTVLQPGQQAYWRVDEQPGGGSGTFKTYIDFEWVEIPLANWTAMVAGLQAKADW